MNIAIIGSGFSSLSASCYLAQMGHKVVVFEKNESLGGRARKFEKDGFVFDMGPSWYWMPDVFDSFFDDFGKKTADYYHLTRLDPSYQVFWKDGVDKIPASMKELKNYFETLEKGAAEQLELFLLEAESKYRIGMGEFVQKPSLSMFEFVSLDTAKKGMSLDLFKSISKHIRQYFSHPKLIELLEFPVLFLGAKPENTPSLYSLMNYADMALGTWYPQGGMNKIVEGMMSVALELGVKFETSSNVERIEVQNGEAKGVIVNGELHRAEIIVSGADYHHTEQHLLEERYRNYSVKYWNKRVMAPSSLLYYVGLDTKVEGLEHHNLFFDEDFGQHAVEIYDTNEWPERPLFYVCCPSKTDSTVANHSQENLFILIPVSTNIEETDLIKERYFNLVSERIFDNIGLDIREHIVVKRDFARQDFIDEYNSFRGNAYGLANTLNQTAILKPKCRNNKLKNLFYAGQLTVPGPGVPPSIISGKIVSQLIQKEFNYESTV